MMIVESPSICKDPKVSVMVLVYNHEPYLRKCLDGILMQDIDFPYEIVIGEDCSTDGSREICLEYQKNFPHIIRLILQDNNKGLIGNYNDICSCLRGEFEACVAGDDYWISKDKIRRQVDFLESHYDIGLCYTNVVICDDIGNENKEPIIKFDFMPKNFEEQLFKTCYMGPSTWVYRGDIRRKICEQQDWFTDESLATALDFLHESKMYFLDIITTVYRVHAGSLAAQIDPIKRWKYELGIFNMQLYYSKKYKCDHEIVNKLYLQEYVNKLISAIEANDQNFVCDMLTYYRSQGMEMKWFVEKCKAYVMFRNQYYMIRNSKAYKIGTFFVKPIKFVRKLFSHGCR